MNDAKQPSVFTPRRIIKTSVSALVLSALGVVAPVIAQSEEGLDELLEEIVVRGQRASIQSAQTLKRDADTIVDSIVADDIGKLPDRSVTETLQRVPGVTIDHFMSLGDPEHFSAEGSGVAVRGLTQVRSELNGRDSFSANGGRSLSFEDVPAELMAGVDVYKNPSADMIEGGLGGTVNLRTRMPFDSDGQVVSGSVSANYGDFIKETDPSYSALYSNRWNTDAGEFGFLVDVAFSEISTRTDGIFNRPFFPRDDIAGMEGTTVQVPRGADWRSMEFNRERLGTYAAFQWRPNDEMEFYLQGFRSSYDMRWDEDAIFVQNDAYATQPAAGTSFNIDANGVFQSGSLSQEAGIPFGADIRVSNRESITTDFSGGFKWTPSDSLEFSTDVQYTKATTESLDATIATGIDLPYIDIDLTDERPQIKANSEYLADPTNYYWAFTMPFIEDNEGDQFAWRGDVKYHFSDDGFLRFAKTGLRYTDRQATNINSGYHWQGVFQPWMAWWKLPGGEPMPSVDDPSQMSLNEFENFFRGDAQLPGNVYAPSSELVEGYPESFDQLHADASAYYLCCDDYVPADITDPSRLNEQEEQTYAAYLTLGFGIDDLALPIDGNIGVRVVRTENVASGMLRYPETIVLGADGVTESQPWYQESEDISAENSYTNVLPSLNLRVTLSDELFLRFAASKAISRASFGQMQAYQSLSADKPEGVPDGEFVPADDFVLTSSSSSNPLLEPMEATQFDVSLEWYFNDAGGMVHVNAFTKQIDGFIRNETILEQHGGWDYTVTRPVNTGTADISGLELGWSQFFDSLPEPFDGLGLQANYTYIDSSTDVPENAGSNPVDTDGSSYGKMPFEGLSENSFNIVGMYEKGPISMRLAYNWRSEFLMSVGPNGFNGTDRDITWRLPVYNDDYGQLDGSIFYDLTDNVSLGLELNNILNSETRTIMKQNAAGDHYASYFVNDTRYALTLRATF
ncbi:TonB-dependent receptor [Gilvimarinus polysaccharolyticus]|uniref:TonB-dependent receptor n=1 Tax=Gilvimarinus polysaccharolyticus TaxID=863921 RepID=UPI000AA6C33B|nr:TonB-dependent receptor [Gilvimarinus polysaccharolyticus]